MTNSPQTYTPRRTYRRKPKGPSADELMKRYGLSWGKGPNGRCINIPSKATQQQVDEVYQAIKEGR